MIALYEALLQTYDKQPGLWLNYGHALRTIGRRTDAVDAYKRCIALAPGHGEAYWSLANLKVDAPSPPRTRRRWRRRPSGKALRTTIACISRYALGKALEDRGDFAASFEHYAAGRRHQTRPVGLRRR